jgi:Histidine kinase-, DNA gyrase B-, and HSP90-like ATPase
MAILTQETEQILGGFSKEINKSATNLMFNVLQQHQYSRPIPSTIREIVSNGLDSITEKRIATEILTGKAKVEDYYIQEEGAIYSDSKFDADYYDLQYLSAVNEVVVIYQEGGEVEKDTVVIRDHGVGLGGKRMEGYFDLGYSSKRLLSTALGKFGIGAKSPLSVGVPFYTIISRHNGKEFCFNVYSHRVESITPQFDMEAGVQNPSYTFSNGYVAYYKVTNEPNMLQIEIAAKKHHKQQYIDAVTSQLLYFKNVRLFVGPKGKEVEIPVLADIMYEDNLIVLSRNSSYSKPHLLLNGVNYG